MKTLIEKGHFRPRHARLTPRIREVGLVRVGQPPAQDRIIVPLTGTIEKPRLNLQKLVELQLQGQIRKGLEELLKRW